MILTTWTKLILFISFITILTVASIPNDSKLGIIYFKSYNYEKALKYFERSKTSHSESPEILKKLKEYFLIQGNVGKALTSQKKITELLPKNISHLEELAKLYNWNNMPYHNLKAREKITLLQPQYLKVKSYLAIAQGYRWLRRYKDADRINAILAKTNDPTYLEHNLSYYLSTKNVDMVIETIEQLEKFSPNNLKYKQYLAQAYILGGKPEEAIQNFMVAIANHPSHKESLYTTKFLDIPSKRILKKLDLVDQIIYLYYDLKREDMVADINSALFFKFKGMYDRGLDAASIYIDLKRPKKAIRIIKKTYSLRSAKRLYRSSTLLTQLGELKLAIKFNKKATRLHPSKTLYLEDLSNLYEMTNQKKKALEIQFKILRLHEKKNNLIYKFYINRDEVLVAQLNQDIKLPPNKAQQTKLKIIVLLEELNNNSELTVFLEKYTKEYPLDLQNKKRLAFLYLEQNNYDKAKSVFEDLYSINPTDPEAATFIIDDQIKEKKYSEALVSITPYKDSTDIGILNRLETIHTALGNKEESAAICKKIQGTEVVGEKYSSIELRTKCNTKDKNYNSSIELLINFITKNPNHEPAYINLCYNYLHNKDIKDARRTIRIIKKMPNQRKAYLDLKKYGRETVRQLKLDRSWEHSLAVEHYKTNINHYWSVITTIVRNFSNYSFGARLHRAEPSGNNDTVGSNAINLKYQNNNDISTTAYIGSNYGKSTKAVYGFKVDYLYDTNLFIQFNSNLNQQVFDIPLFTSEDEATQDNMSLYLEYTQSLKNKYILFGQLQKYHVNDLEADQQNLSLQYNRYINKNFSAGIYLFESELLSADDSLRSSLLEKSSIRSIHFSYEKNFYKKKILNLTTLYIGADSAREMDFGEYISILNRTTFFHSRRKEAFLAVQWNKESLNINENESLRINLGYNFWFL